MLYLIDANVLITANNLYYPIDRVPEYWEWLVHVGTLGQVKMPFEIFEEVKLVQKVTVEGYAADLSDDEIEQMGRDPFLIAYGLAAKNRCVVTVETSAPKKQRQNRKVPDVCRAMGLDCCNPFEFNRALGFRTQWKLDLNG
jgi:Domain of unknown function (DUF4411)